MLLEFGGSNFCSFKEWFNIDFQLGPNCPGNLKKDSDVAKLICIKGANSSGKTNILKFLNFLNDFCANSFQLKPDENIPLHNYFFNQEPTEIYCLFQDKLTNTIYKYEAKVNKQEVISECLYRKKSKYVCLINREKNEIVGGTKEFIKKFANIKLRNNASIISTAWQYELEEFKYIYRFFRTIFSNVSLHGLQSTLCDVNFASKNLYNQPSDLNFVKKIIQKFDPALKDIYIDVQKIDGQERFIPRFKYYINDDEKILSYDLQSSGTKALYTNLIFYKIILDIGGVLALDEFDINLHPDILPFLLNLFESSEINKKNAQLIFTTHNIDIMDTMSKYRTYLVNKEEGESYAYRLDEIPSDLIRNDRSIASLYKSNKIGGTPKFSWDIEDLI